MEVLVIFILLVFMNLRQSDQMMVALVVFWVHISQLMRKRCGTLKATGGETGAILNGRCNFQIGMKMYLYTASPPRQETVFCSLKSSNMAQFHGQV